jgi:hypothetical protein
MNLPDGFDPDPTEWLETSFALANDKPPVPVRINGRPIDRSAHYKAPGKGGKRRRKR